MQLNDFILLRPQGSKALVRSGVCCLARRAFICGCSKNCARVRIRSIMDPLSDIHSLKYTTLKYGPHALQRVGVWQYDSSPSSGYWIVFIHGGAWRDPRNSLYDFVPSIKRMASSPPGGQVAGFASIDYRLSHHPGFPQDPATTPAAELRDAKHPDHRDDVVSALTLLDSDHGISGKYVLVGHSAGATLAYQAVMGDAPLPAAIIGIAGIYDLRGLCARREGYDGFIGGAFGTDRSAWDEASPARFRGSFANVLSILAASPEDSLVDEAEVDSMANRLLRDGVELVTVKDLTGEHDSIWQEGSQVAELITRAFATLQRSV